MDLEGIAQQAAQEGGMKLIADELLSWAAGFAGKVILALIVWYAGKQLVKLIMKLIRKALERSNLDVGVVKFVLSFARAACYVVLAITVIDILGFQTSSFIAILGSAGLAFGLALQGSLSNFAGGILLLIFKPFVIGNYIITDKNEGKVVAVDLLYTKLLTVDNKTVMIPNGTLANTNITNVSSQQRRRLDIEVGISYNSDLKLAKELLYTILRSNDKIIQDDELVVVVKNLGDSCVLLETRAWLATEDYWNVRFDLLEQYKESFDAHGIEIPYNQLDVHIRRELMQPDEK